MRRTSRFASRARWAVHKSSLLAGKPNEEQPLEESSYALRFRFPPLNTPPVRIELTSPVFCTSSIVSISEYDPLPLFVPNVTGIFGRETTKRDSSEERSMKRRAQGGNEKHPTWFEKTWTDATSEACCYVALCQDLCPKIGSKILRSLPSPATKTLGQGQKTFEESRPAKTG